MTKPAVLVVSSAWGDVGAANVFVVLALFGRLFPRITSMHAQLHHLNWNVHGIEVVHALQSTAEADAERRDPPGAPQNLPIDLPTELSVRDLVVTYENGQQRTTQLSGRALGTSMSVTPDGDIDFGPVCSGQTADQPFVIVGNDQGSFKVNAISTPDAPFTVTAPTLPTTVQGVGGNQVMFTVTAAPTMQTN